jgi:hypothetical protein
MKPQFPQPPLDLAMPETVQYIAALAVALPALALLVAGVLTLRRKGTAVPLLFLIGCGISTINEPIMDELCLVWHHGVGQATAFETFGRPIPLWVPFSYIAYFGGLTWLLFKFLRRSPTPRQVWLGVVSIFALNLMLELPILALDMFTYYGDQPYRVAGFPAPQAFINGGGVLLSVVLLCAVPQLFAGRRRWGILLLPTGTQLAATVMIAFPIVAMGHTRLPAGLRWGAATVSIVLGVIVFDGLIRYLCARVAAAQQFDIRDGHSQRAIADQAYRQERQWEMT